MMLTVKLRMAGQLQQSLLNGQLDMAILHWEIRRPYLEFEPIAQMDFGWVGSPPARAPK